MVESDRRPGGAEEEGRRSLRASLVVGAGVVVLLGLGAAALVLSWSRAAGTSLVPLQIPALLAAVVGVALIGTGLAVLDLDLFRRQEAEEARTLESAIEGVRLRGRPGRPVRTD